MRSPTSCSTLATSKIKSFSFVGVLLLLLLSSHVIATLVPPSSVTWNVDPLALLPTIQSGRIVVSWSPAIGSVDSYQVIAAPLDYTDALTDPVYSGFVVDVGDLRNSITYGAGGLSVSTHGGHDSNDIGRSTTPLVFRKVPMDSVVDITVNCASLGTTFPSWRCGGTVFDGSTNSSLFTFGLMKGGGGGGGGVVRLQVHTPGSFGAGTPINSANTASDASAWSASSTVILRIARYGSGSTRPWILSARPSSFTDTYTSWVNFTLPPSALPSSSFVEADLWIGMEAAAFGGSTSTLATASFTGFRISVPVPKTPPRDLYNALDMCVDYNTGIVPLITTVSVAASSTSSVSLAGLSGYFPYTLTVVAIEAGTLLPYPSAPLEGIYFYPRRMPPRAHKLGLWLDGRGVPGGALARWADSSMRGHDLVQPDSARRPTVTAGNVFQISTPNFRRAAAQFLTSGSDIFDLGIAGDFTAYIMARGTTSTPQVIMGRGAPATTLTGEGPDHIGWTAMVYNELYFPYPGYLGLKVGDGYSPTAGTKKVHWIPSTGGYNWYASVPVYTLGAQVRTRSNPLSDPKIPYSGLFLTSARDSDETIISPGIADAWGDNTTGVAGMAWYRDLVNGSIYPSPPTSPSSVFRVGGPAVSAGGDVSRSFDGDIWQILLYREAHNSTVRSSIQNWLQDYSFGNQCAQSITTPNTDSGGQCGGQFGYGALRCWQTCKSGYQWFMGTWNDHWCSNGAWGGAALLCKKGCGDAIPPLYVATCKRTIVSDDFRNAAATRLMYIPYPTLPSLQVDKIWTFSNDTNAAILGSTTYLRANPGYSDPCARMTAQPSIFGIHPNRWNDIYLPWGSKAWFALSVLLESDNSTAGMAFRISDSNNNYRVILSSKNGISLIRMAGGRLVTVATNKNVAFDLWTWYNVETVYEKSTITVLMNNNTLLSVNDVGGPNWGSVGYFADGGPARFGNMSINSTCDLFNQARNMASGMRVTYECKKGYELLGNTTWTCGDDGTYGKAQMVCKSFPPVFGNYSFSIEEHSANGTTIGVAYAKPANPEQLLTYSLVAQYPSNSSFSPAFSVVACSGAIRVFDPYQLDYQLVTQYNLTLMAVPDGQMIAAAYTNVTINIINVVDPPVLLPTVVYINETLSGAVSSPMEVYNPDKFTLRYTIGAGDSSSRFTLDPDTGLVYVKPPGLLYADNPQYDLLIYAVAQEDLSLQTSAVLSVMVVDTDTPPVFEDEVFYIPEGMAKTGTFLGIIPFSDPDVVSDWNVVTLNITRNIYDMRVAAGKKPLFVLDNTTGALFFDATLTYGTGDMVYWFGDRKARDIFDLAVTACDNGGACTSATTTVVVLATNVTDLASLITGISSPANGMKTDGGEIIKFLGKDFPFGGIVTAQYGSVALGATFAAVSCFVKDFGTIQCSSAPGFGAGLTWRVFINAYQVPTTVALVTSYAPPVLYSVDVEAVGLSTTGSALAAVTIKGENFGGSTAPITITYGSGVYSFTIPSINSVGHTQIKATLGPGCGSNLNVVVTVGGQASSNLGGTTPVISYPQPTITTLSIPSGMTYTLNALSSTDSVDIVVEGLNFGPDSLQAGASTSPLLPQATYAGPVSAASPTFTYHANCRKDDTSKAHTRLLCRLSPGVSYDMGWTVDICGQSSPQAPVRTSYAAPVLTRISGPGAARASTEGGQNVILDGTGFGPLCCDLSNPSPITLVRYGDPSLLQYQAVGCRVVSTSPPQITCLTGPGTGKDHVWEITVGGQASPILVANTSYSPPVIYNFLGAAADSANTQGYENVTVVGSHFGAVYNPSLVKVSYMDTITAPSDFSSSGLVVPGSPPGSMTYTPPWCIMSVPHKQLTCGLQPGAGVGINWVVVVDSQVSTAPTTAYGVPVITSLTLVGGKTKASTDGGDLLDIQGLNFGIPSLLQRISFGPTGTEYKITTNVTLSTHTQLRVILGPAISLGAPMRFQVSVADQVSDLSLASLNFATPSVTSVTPISADGEVDPARPTTITVTGTEFGLLDPTADVAIAFGNPEDNTLLPLIAPTSRSPTAEEVVSLTWIKPASPVTQTITFALPAGLGKDRRIRVVPYRRGGAPSLAAIAALPSQGAAATFSYLDPFIDYIVVSPVTLPDEVNDALVLFGGSLNGTDVAQLRKLEIRGRYFGPSQATNKDAVVRIVEERVGGSGSGVFAGTAFRVGNWTHRLITAYAYRSAATIRVRLVSKAIGGSDITQLSGLSSYSDVSPSVDGIVGATDGFATAGGGIVTFKAGGLDSCVQLNVTIGGRRCILLDGPTVSANTVDENDARSKIILAQGNPPFAVSFLWTISCLVPEGEGTAAIVIIRDGVKSSDGVSIRYAPPTIDKVGSYDSVSGTFIMIPFIPSTSTVVVPTESWGVRTVRIEGANLGVCPKLTVAIDMPVFIDACIETQDVLTGAPIITINPSVTRSHSYIEFVAPDGEGSGMDVAPPRGWKIAVSAGGQAAPDDILFRYAPPSVFTISPTTGPTRGHTTLRPQVLTLTVKNIGKKVPSVFLGSLTRTWMPCKNVQRLSNESLSCELPEGSGVRLAARVVVADLHGDGGEFNYTQPTISFMRLGKATLDVLTNFTSYTFGASIVPNNVGTPNPPYLRLPTMPAYDDVIVIEGDSFGPHDGNDNCAFVTWAQRDLFTWSPSAGTPPTTGPLVCNGNREDFLGEGQIVDALDVLEYGHDRIIFRAPPGAGLREVTLRAGGQAPPASTSYANLQYEGPVIVGPLVRMTELNTDGGGKSHIPAINVPRGPFPTPGNYDPNATGAAAGIGILSYPAPLPLSRNLQPPTEHIVVRFGSTRCLTSAHELNGFPALGTSTCVDGDSLLTINASPNSLGADSADGLGPGITFLVPPGVGANKSIIISVLSNGVEIASSNVGSFSYDPPQISRVEPSPVYQRLDTPRTYLVISGKNFGRSSDELLYSPEEKTLSVFISDVECHDAIRIYRLSTFSIQCQLSLGIPVGHRNVSVVVGGQAGTVPERDPRGIFIVCSQGLYGMDGEPCTSCPFGATCKGFIPDEQLVVDAGVNVTEGPVRLGRVQYDIGGVHTYPIPDPGFFNLNGSMAVACPPGMKIAGRDICIVPCMPSTSCQDDNVCAEAYQSLAPMYRCASCARGFYRRNGDCEKCPQNSAAQFIILLFMAMVVAAAAYWMNKYNINPAFISIGLDFFQVIAIFAQSKVPWPAVIKDLFYILSAFNLNLEILAPECFLPEVTFSNKFAAIISMPIIVYLLFTTVHGVLVAYKRGLKQQAWKKVNSHLPGIISASLLLLYIFYLYVTKTILDVFNCVPTEPPDGRLYLAAVFEECYSPGGAHMTLLPYAGIAVVVYTIGYPAFLGQLLYRRSDLVMEDQYLRAKGAGDSRLENPHAYSFRRTFSRVYYQFKPEYYFWILVIIVRKFCIAFTSLMFGRNVGFQMAACLMVLFLAYAAQVRYSPFMSPDEQDSVIRKLLELSASSKLHNRLRATLAQVESTGRKKGRSNKLTVRSKFAAVSALYYMAGLLFNYNFVDATLLFSACIVNLCGLLYQAARPQDTFFQASRDGITGVVLAVIALSVLYWFAVVIVDVASQFKSRVEESAKGRAKERLQRKKAKTKKRMNDEGSKFTQKLPDDIFTRGLGGNNTHEITMSNPMFLRKDTGSAIVTVEQAHSAIMDMENPPDKLIWDMFRNTYADQHVQVRALSEQLNAAKAENNKLQETIENAGLSGLLYDSSRVVLDAYNRGGNRGPQASRRQFGQQSVGVITPKGSSDAEMDEFMNGGSKKKGDNDDDDDDEDDSEDEDENCRSKSKRFSLRGIMGGFGGGGGGGGGSEIPPPPPTAPGAGKSTSNRASMRLGALFGLGGNPLSSNGSANTAGGGIGGGGDDDDAHVVDASIPPPPSLRAGGGGGNATINNNAIAAASGNNHGWRTSLRMSGFNLKNVASMVSAHEGGGNHSSSSSSSATAAAPASSTIPPSRGVVASLFSGNGGVLKSGGTGIESLSEHGESNSAIFGGNPLSRSSMSPLAVARGSASSNSSSMASSPAAGIVPPTSLSAAATPTPSVPTGRGKRLAGKVIVKDAASVSSSSSSLSVAGSKDVMSGATASDEGSVSMSSPMAGRAVRNDGKTAAALQGFKAKYGAALDD